MAAITMSQCITARPRVAVKTTASSRATPVKAVPRAETSALKRALVGAGVGALLAAQIAVLPSALADIPNPFQGSIEETRESSKMPATRGEIGGGTAAESKGEQANSLQRAAGEATGRDGAQIPDKMQDIGQASGSPK
ncbi:g4742 [Coccomyxa viridis]|uniref:G4742 protein n=1 Tax=Coccomyxa viridis TaxID=1274662 RepID=A0ABP1FSI3_9CHLO